MGKSENALARFMRKVVIQARGCWIWSGARSSNGYGVFWYGGRSGSAHRFSYEQFVGAIEEGREIDHLCRTRNCVNPAHLEVVTRAENLRRSPITVQAVNARKQTCVRGHPYDLFNTYVSPSGKRICRACARERRAA